MGSLADHDVAVVVGTGVPGLDDLELEDGTERSGGWHLDEPDIVHSVQDSIPEAC